MRCMATGAGFAASGAAGYCAVGANCWSDRSRTCARPAGCDGSIFEGIRTFSSGCSCASTRRLPSAPAAANEEFAEATLADTRKAYLAELTRVPLLIIDDLGMRKLPHTAAEELLELIMRRYEWASTMLTSNRPVDDWGKLLGDTAAVTALLDRLLHHAHILKCGPRSWRTRVQTTLLLIGSLVA